MVFKLEYLFNDEEFYNNQYEINNLIEHSTIIKLPDNLKVDTIYKNIMAGGIQNNKFEYFCNKFINNLSESSSIYNNLLIYIINDLFFPILIFSLAFSNDTNQDVRLLHNQLIKQSNKSNIPIYLSILLVLKIKLVKHCKYNNEYNIIYLNILKNISNEL